MHLLGAPRQLIYNSEPEGCILSYPHLYFEQEILEVCISQHDIQVPSTPIWPVIQPKSVY